MIFNIKHLILFIVTILFCNCCCSQKNDNTAYDLDGLPLMSYAGDSLLFSNINYCDLKGRRYQINQNVYYQNGVDSLKSYIIESYYNHPGYSHQEINTMFFFCVFFDKKLRIKEVRFIDMGLTDEQKVILNENLNLDIIEEIIKQTNGNWYLTTKGRKRHYQLFIGNVKIM